MYMSRIQLTDAIAQKSQLRHVLKDRSYGIHRLLKELFNDSELDKPGRLLFREESSREQLATARNLPLYYVLSQVRPSVDSLIFKVDSKPFSPVLHVGDELAFRLRANPTVSRSEPGVKRSKRHDVVMDAQRRWLQSACQERQLDTKGSKGELKARLQCHPDFPGKSGASTLNREINTVIDQAARRWLQERGPENGFELKACQTTGYRWHALPEKDRKAGFSSLDYEGSLTVMNTENFLQRVYMGFGHSRAFGCGLMLIRRA